MASPRPGTRAHANEIAIRLEKAQGHIEWRRRRVLQQELHVFGGSPTEDFGDGLQGEIHAGGDATAGRVHPGRADG